MYHPVCLSKGGLYDVGHLFECSILASLWESGKEHNVIKLLRNSTKSACKQVGYDEGMKIQTHTSWETKLFVLLPKRAEKQLLQVPDLTNFLPVSNCSSALILAGIRVACHVAHQLLTRRSSGPVSARFQLHVSCWRKPHQHYPAVAVDCGRTWVCLACMPRFCAEAAGALTEALPDFPEA